MNWFKRLFTRRRVLVGVPLVLLGLLVFGLWAGLRAQQVYRDLQGAEGSAREAKAAAEAGDQQRMEAALARLRSQAASARERTSGTTWSVLSAVPFVGDDARGVRAISESLDVIAREAADPLVSTFGALREVNRGGQLDLATIKAMRAPVDRGRQAVQSALTSLRGQESSGFVAPLRSRYDTFTDMADDLGQALDAAADASRVLPTALGGEGARDYLMFFLNNAEIRSSGGLPGAFAQIRAENGKLTLVRQGTESDLGTRETPVLPLSAAERELFGDQLGIYVRDANFIQDMPRTAELLAARWKDATGEDLDGVITLDTVGMSYLLEGAGRVQTPTGTVLTPDNAVTELLHRTYQQVPDPQQQNLYFATVAGSVFTAVTSDVSNQFALVRSLGRAAGEGRLLVHSFHAAEQKVLAGKRIAGELTSAPATSPEVDLGFDDATGSKMSYYLRYRPEITSVGCGDGRQTILGSLLVSSTIEPGQVSALPDYITGGGVFGTEPGNQTVIARLYGPVGGSIDSVVVEGEPVDYDVVTFRGRPAVVLALGLEPAQSNSIEWTMTSGAGQTGPVDLEVTPGIEPGTVDSTSKSACP